MIPLHLENKEYQNMNNQLLSEINKWIANDRVQTTKVHDMVEVSTYRLPSRIIYDRKNRKVIVEEKILY
jgi:hypothetical protein